ncbi:S-adenosyl-L-methionine-dependent methyltransferase [Nemania sp. FL0916]|nr:S-adenosyl-L-methionine-dependent methyltransferase [Nemania sp. FL0916]
MNNTQSLNGKSHKKQKRPPRPKRNPIEIAVRSWCEKYVTHLKTRHLADSDLIAQAPKRWTAYGPLVLLPAGAFTSLAWRSALEDVPDTSPSGPASRSERVEEVDDENLKGAKLLWKTILAEIAVSPRAELTHLAVNEGIPLYSKQEIPGSGSDPGARGEGEGVSGSGSENILRSPGGLRMLYGDFGPPTLTSPGLKPVESDYARAFWVSTKQNGITQTWAPRWTMFSRGNIKEKTRLLHFHDTHNDNDDSNNNNSAQRDLLSHRHIPASQRASRIAVDLFAGIGYFAFSYAAMGLRVFCWELNPWSVEGLRRGAAANGWSVRVVDTSGCYATRDQREEDMLRDVINGDEDIVVFLENNAYAEGRLKRLDELSREHEHEHELEARGEEDRDNKNDRRSGSRGFRMRDVLHVNCGLLPSSEGSWLSAWAIAIQSPRAWLHIHENVGVADIEARTDEIEEQFAEWNRNGSKDGVEQGKTRVCAEHVEMVKTFAPGVWHCVFDVYVEREVERAANLA